LPLKLHENTITLLLGEAEAEDGNDSDMGSETENESENDEDEDEDENKVRRDAPRPTESSVLAIDIDLSLSAWTNASQYYDQKKTAVVKEVNTLKSTTLALKSAERKIAADLKKGLTQEKEVLRPVRKQFWFEKFHYFVSSDGYLVLGGKDAQQNEILYRRYLRKGDIYVHADMNGASSVIIKNNPATPDAPIPPSTLSQAGSLSVASSSAWDSKAMMSAWWVNSDQVSKTAPTGEYLTTGGFIVRGKKNFMPPAQMLLGFAAMFQISEESKARHRKHRIQEPSKSDLEASMTSFTEDGAGTLASHGTHQGSDNESDEEFPDAKLDATNAGSDDEDFPDATLEAIKNDVDSEDAAGPAGSESDSEDDEDIGPSKNPLQSTSITSANDRVGGLSGDSANRPPLTVSNLETHSSSSVADTEGTIKTGPRHLSAKERQLLRKGHDPASVANKKAENDSQDEGTDDATLSVISSMKPKNQPLPRGKRGKQKKAAAKYAYQDEEDRALAIRLLGSNSGQDAAAAEAAARKAKEEEALAQKNRRREQHLKSQAIGKAEEEARRAAIEGTNEDDANDEDEDSTRLTLLSLDTFVGRPLPGDELLALIPVCAPWSALAAYKYKAKLQPGAMKKGKAVNEILGKWQSAAINPRFVDPNSEDVERIWPREVELIKGWKALEVVGVIPVTKVRVMMAGGGDGKGVSGGGSGAKGKGKGGRGGRGSKKKKH